MQNLFEEYIESVSKKFSREETSEMGYRTEFEILLKGIFQTIKKLDIDHDAKARQGNKPDFAVLENGIPILYLEVKDIGESLDKAEKSEQMARYYGYANLVLTDYVEFRFYRNGLRYEEPIKIANYDPKHRTIAPLSENYAHLAKAFVDFAQSHKEPIKSGEHLARIMGGKAQRIRDNVRQFLHAESGAKGELFRLYVTVKKLLVHDLTIDSFADMYAQTLVYGLFIARYHDDTPESFSRQEARDLMPSSNPFLRHFFDHIVGPDFDKRLEYIINELCEVFCHADIKILMQQYYEKDLWGKVSEGPDPVIHFYEDFLKEYDPVLRKKLGAYYTPLPVVRFIVRSVDALLEEEFGLTLGLANTSKMPGGVHKVQILDPAVGTGTFISTAIGVIYERLKKEGQKGRWPAYVHRELLPRLHGFELMMAPYTIAHLKLSMAFKKTGFWSFHRRLGIYLTNSLEESPIQKDLIAAFGLAESIAEESKEASAIKNKTPVMVIIGNPPYSGVSSNETEYANRLVDKYKMEPGGKVKLQERKHWLNDDYVKFIAFSEGLISKNGEGILGFITNHGYLDNPTFRGMRWHLLNTFDCIYIIDLHGNTKKKEVASDGTKDENVFGIKQGVSILIAVKTRMKKGNDLAKIYRADFLGSRESKFEQLNNLSLRELKMTAINPEQPYFLFTSQGVSDYKDIVDGDSFLISDLFFLQSMGITSARDDVVIDFDQDKILARVGYMTNLDYTDAQVRSHLFSGKKDGKYNAGDTRGWKLSEARKNILNENHFGNIKEIAYRPFDIRKIYYHSKMVDWGREKVMRHFLEGENLGLCAVKLGRDVNAHNFYISNRITDKSITSSLDNANVFPLYLYDKDGSKTSNLREEVVAVIEKYVGKVTPEDILDYIYAVLYSPNYREKYKELSKIDFPRVPYPKDPKGFKRLVALGTELRELHLMESSKLNRFITIYPVEGSNVVEKPVYKEGNVCINKTQYFGNVPEIAWNFHIGGYQPAQKWLKDRKGRELSDSDLEHYQKIIVVLVETDRIMKEIDKIVQF